MERKTQRIPMWSSVFFYIANLIAFPPGIGMICVSGYVVGVVANGVLGVISLRSSFRP